MSDGLLYSTLLKLRVLEGQPRRDRHAYRGLSMVLALLRERHPHAAEALHRDAQDKPITMSPLEPAKGAPGTWCLRLTLLDQELFGALADAVLSRDPERPLELGDAKLSLEGLVTVPGTDPRVDCSSYSKLVDDVPPGEVHWKLDFLTPTAFRSKAGHAPFPAVPLVFGSLGRRWSRFSPIPLPAGLMACLEEQITVAEYRIRQSRLGFGGFFEPGFTGWCAFAAKRKASSEVLHWAGALIRFAYFSGVGAKTTMGMGQARLAPEASTS